MPSASRKDLSLKWLELFQICARKGSMQAAAEEAGLSVSTVSHHIKSLEDHLGVALFNHARRPMVLTPKGQVFLRNIDLGLESIRKAQAEASAGNIIEASYLRIGTIEDFDSDITPALAVYLSKHMDACDFLYATGTSRQIIDMLRDRKLDLGITTSPPERLKDVTDRPLLNDPFAVVVPANFKGHAEGVLEGSEPLPFLRFSSDLIIAQQIEAQLSRLGASLPVRFESANTQTIMAMVANGAGWTIATPLLFSRARRFQPKLKLLPFPGKSFARQLSLLSTPDCSRSMIQLVEQQVRKSIQTDLLAPLHDKAPWLKDRFRLIDA